MPGYYETGVPESMEKAMASAEKPSPLRMSLERLESQVGELAIQTDRLRHKIDPLISTQVPPTPNGGVPSGDMFGSSDIVQRIAGSAARLEEIGQKVCRWCNELEI